MFDDMSFIEAIEAKSEKRVWTIKKYIDPLYDLLLLVRNMAISFA